MKFSLATNFDNALIDAISGHNVHELYGKQKCDFISGGRPITRSNNIDTIAFEKHVEKVREANINFNYLLNGSCTSNVEQNKEWQIQFKEFINYLRKIGVNAFTITNPIVLLLVKEFYPEAILCVSTFAKVNNHFKAAYWGNLGADVVCADFAINRDFSELEKMIKVSKPKIKLLATNSCLKDCPIMGTHTNSISHADYGYIDWCLHECQCNQLKHLEEYIKSPWLRPEDLKYYRKIGIEYIKITERGIPTEQLIKRLNAYNTEIYDGNLLDLIQAYGFEKKDAPIQKIVPRIEFENVADVDYEIRKIRGMEGLREYMPQVFINNNKLDHFLEYFYDGKCLNDCISCSYCKNTSDNVIIRNEEISDYLVFLYSELNRQLIKERGVSYE